MIAEVQGVATAAGCQLVASCDLAVAADTAKFATFGRQYRPVLLHPDGGAVPQYRAQGSDGNAADRRHGGSPGDAVRIGLINRAVPAEKLRAETMALAAEDCRQTIRHPAHRQTCLLPAARNESWQSVCGCTTSR